MLNSWMDDTTFSVFRGVAEINGRKGAAETHTVHGSRLTLCLHVWGVLIMNISWLYIYKHAVEAANCHSILMLPYVFAAVE